MSSALPASANCSVPAALWLLCCRAALHHSIGGCPAPAASAACSASCAYNRLTCGGTGSPPAPWLQSPPSHGSQSTCGASGEPADAKSVRQVGHQAGWAPAV